ncbi:hypothetical protein ACFYRD_25510 [Streptomyces hirsutus]|uniref:hypothetical protein n=1 Tax=Streptomyces hirsutus TaxID=35620 RepID=UPI0036B07186
MTTAAPQRPDLARELIARAQASAAHRARRLRNQLDAVQLGQGRHADHANTKVLRRILGEHEWPGHRLLGPAAACTAWSIALHSDDEPDFQRAAAILLERAVKAGDALIQHWAHLHDRALINNSRSCTARSASTGRTEQAAVWSSCRSPSRPPSTTAGPRSAFLPTASRRSVCAGITSPPYPPPLPYPSGS